MASRPRYVTFDCYGTFTCFRMGELKRELFADRIRLEQMERCIADFSACQPTEIQDVGGPPGVVGL